VLVDQLAVHYANHPSLGFVDLYFAVVEPEGHQRVLNVVAVGSIADSKAVEGIAVLLHYLYVFVLRYIGRKEWGTFCFLLSNKRTSTMKYLQMVKKSFRGVLFCGKREEGAGE